MRAHTDWDPRGPEVQADPIGAYDTMRARCPVAHGGDGHHALFRHADVMRVLHEPQTFGSGASDHVSVPHSMDPPEHTAFRRLIDPYFSAARMADFQPVCERLCSELVDRLPAEGPVELMFGLAHPFALSMQCAFLGWPETLHEPLLRWILKKNAVVLSGDRRAIAAVGQEFDAAIRELLAARRAAGANAPDDATTRLLHETIDGRPLSEDEIVSILRNWTVGELGTIAASVGIIALYLARHPQLQQRLRAEPDLVRGANDEILRIQAPLLGNRRILTRPARVGGKDLPAGERLVLMWASANRDETVFGDPDQFRLDRDPALNLLYGAGIHACPGAPLARLELETLIRALLAATRRIEPVPDAPLTSSAYPTGGYREVPLRILR